MTATMPDQDNAVFERLLRGSAKQSYDPEVDVDWDAPLVEGKWGITPERISIYATELLDTELFADLAGRDLGAADHTVQPRGRLNGQRRGLV